MKQKKKLLKEDMISINKIILLIILILKSTGNMYATMNLTNYKIKINLLWKYAKVLACIISNIIITDLMIVITNAKILSVYKFFVLRMMLKFIMSQKRFTMLTLVILNFKFVMFKIGIPSNFQRTMMFLVRNNNMVKKREHK